MPQTIACPNCGAPLQIDSAFTTYLVCSYCGQSLTVHDTGVDLAGHVAKLADFPSRLSVGARGQVKGQGYLVLGRIRYENDAGFWDEWFLQLADQRAAWLEEDQGELTLIFKSKLTSPVPPFEQVRVGSFIPVGQWRVFVSEKGQTQVSGAEGQVAMTAPPGHTIRYVQGNAGNKALRIMIDDQGITLYTGEPLEFNDVVVAG
jgi:hypothetical protein